MPNLDAENKIKKKKYLHDTSLHRYTPFTRLCHTRHFIATKAMKYFSFFPHISKLVISIRLLAMNYLV